MKKIILLLATTLISTAHIHAQKLTVHTIGDSTMADYVENTTRTRGWGEMLQEFFTSDVRIINYARGGRSSRSFTEEGLWDKVKSNLNPGDYVCLLYTSFRFQKARLPRETYPTVLSFPRQPKMCIRDRVK